MTNSHQHGKVVAKRNFHPQKNITLWTYGHVRSGDKLKTYIHFHNAYGYLTCHCGDIPQVTPTHKFSWPLNVLVFWGDIIN